MTGALELVDRKEFTRLFTEKLGWNRPSQHDLTVPLGEAKLTLKQVADYRGLGIWHCPAIPPRKGQLLIDKAVSKRNTNRLIIFTEGDRQEWRWPRYSKVGVGSPRLVNHPHLAGNPNPQLLERLDLIAIEPGSQITVPELLHKMRDAFNVEAEKASVAAARLMGDLYERLAKAKTADADASLFLARILFLMFGDDTDMWKSSVFHDYLTDHTAPDGSDLGPRIQDVFYAANTPEAKRRTNLDPHLRNLPYINGGLFAEPADLSTLPGSMRQALIDTCKFDWGQISPAVFGSMFQVVKDIKERRALGEHYTTEANILKTIGPLFLDELHERLEAAWDDKSQLTRLHNSLKDYRFLDPACGCGNFLIVAYREMRAFELEILKRRRDLDELDGKSSGPHRSQLSLDATIGLNVTVEQFFGIEIEPWPARIAETAMFLIDHQANLQMEQELGQAPRRLPIELTPHISTGNALRAEWSDLIPPSSTVLIFGNPPFIGARTLSREAREDMLHVWGKGVSHNLDYVTCWYRKAVSYYGQTHDGRWAFVSTNSICQGEPVADLWAPILDAGWSCRFAHKSFRWTSEAAGAAAVHVSIVGFDRRTADEGRVLWSYPDSSTWEPAREVCANINPYLIAGPNVLVRARRDPLNHSLPEPAFGHRAIDGGNLIVESIDCAKFESDPIAKPLLKRLVGSKELMHNAERWCLWMPYGTPGLDGSEILASRVEAVRTFRLASKNPATVEAAETPYRFGILDATQLENTEWYLAIPRVVSERREYFAAAYFPPDVISSDAVFTAPDPEGYALGVLSSTMFMTWQKAVGGRLESRIRFSKTFTYNTFPLPKPTEGQKAALCLAAQAVLTARDAHPEKSLAQLYDPRSMPNDLRAAHEKVDQVVDSIFGIDGNPTLEERQTILFEQYRKLSP